MEWETADDAEPGSNWAPPQPSKKKRRPHKDLVKWQHCFRDNCSVHRWVKLDAGYYPRIVRKDGVLSKRDETHRKRRRNVRRRHKGEGGEKTSSDVERLEKEILGLWEQLTHAAETVVLKDQQLIKRDNEYRALCRSERHVAQNLAQEKGHTKRRKVIAMHLSCCCGSWVVSCGGKNVSSRRDSARGRRELMSRMVTKQGRYHAMRTIDS